jgi:aminoglycoside phosphotransferase (APT) family kinase protein
MHRREVEVTAPLVRRLLDAQMPALADETLRRVDPWGTDHAIWRLGNDLVVRFPRIEWAADQPAREAIVLPFLAPRLPVAVPEPVAVGEPGFGYPYPWAVHRWIAGERAPPSGTTSSSPRSSLGSCNASNGSSRVPLRQLAGGRGPSRTTTQRPGQPSIRHVI